MFLQLVLSLLVVNSLDWPWFVHTPVCITADDIRVETKPWGLKNWPQGAETGGYGVRVFILLMMRWLEAGVGSEQERCGAQTACSSNRAARDPQTQHFLILGYWMLIIDRIFVLFAFVVRKLVNIKLLSENRLFCLGWFFSTYRKSNISAHLFMVKVENSSMNKNISYTMSACQLWLSYGVTHQRGNDTNRRAA